MSSEMQMAILGILGTLGGTVLGWFLNNLSQTGRLNIYATSWKDEFKYRDEMGCLVPSMSKEQTEYYEYKLSLDLYNSSGEIKIMRDVKVIFAKNTEELYICTPKDDSTRRASSHMVFFDEVSAINIPARTVVNINLHNGKWKEQNNDKNGLEFLWKTNRIYLLYKNEKNKEKRVLIKSIDYKESFGN